MILILEDDADREAYQRGGSPFRQDFYTEDEDKNPVTVWISPKAYEEKARADERKQAATRMYLQREHMRADLRAKVEALPTTGVYINRDQVLELFDGSSDD